MAVLCHSCFQDIPAASLRCPRCGAPLSGPPPGPQPGPEGSPWQRRREKGLFAAFAETLEKSLLEPAAFFRELRPGGGGDALGYAVVVNVITAAIAWLWHSALTSPADGSGGTGLAMTAAVLLVLVPVATIVLAGAWSAVLHMALTLTGGARRSFSFTVQAVGYAASANSFSVFPLVGSLIGIPWGVVLQVIGLREGHGISTARALLALVLPLLLFLLIASVLFFLALDALFEYLPEIEGLIMA